MSVIDTRDSRQIKLVQALTKLVDNLGEDTVGRAYSEVLRVRIHERWTKAYGEGPDYSRISDMLPFPSRLLYSDNAHEIDAWENQRPPGADHDALLEKDGVFTFLTQPYTLTMETLKELIPWCEERGLKFDISTGAQHFATRCVLVRIIKERDIPQEPLKPVCEWKGPGEYDLERIDHFGREGRLVALEEAHMVLQKETRGIWVPQEDDPFGCYEKVAEAYGTTSFETLASTSYRPRKSTLPFQEWIFSKTHLRDFVGDLAKDMVRDASLPKTNDPAELYQYLYTVRPSTFNVRNALAHAWLAFCTGFKEFPIGPPTLHLPKAYALLSGLLHALDDVEPEVTWKYRRLPLLLKGALEVLGRYVPEKIEHNPDTQEGALSDEGHVQVGTLLKESRALLVESCFQVRLTYLDDDRVVRALKRAEQMLNWLRSDLEDISAMDCHFKNWEASWYYGKTDDPRFTRADHLLLEP